MTTAAINMDFGLTEEQQALVESITTVLEARSTPERLRELDASEQWYDLDTWSALARADVLGVAVPEDLGGLGYGILETCLLLEQVGRFVAPVPMLPTLVAAALPIARYGTEAQRAQLADVARGDRILTAALTEEGAPPEEPVTTAARDGNGWRIQGVKTLVPAVNVAAAVLTPVSVDDEIGLLLVPVDTPGLTAARQRVMGGEPHHELRYDGVRVGDDALIGTLGQGRGALRSTLEHATVGLCAVAAGVTDRALRITADYTTTRKQFGRPIGTFQAVGQRLADAFIHARAVRLSMLLAATRLEEGRDAPMEVATAKYWASEGANFVGHAALHVHGGISIDLDYPIHRYFLWGKQLELTLGSATPRLRELGRLLADAPVG